MQFIFAWIDYTMSRTWRAHGEWKVELGIHILDQIYFHFIGLQRGLESNILQSTKNRWTILNAATGALKIKWDVVNRKQVLVGRRITWHRFLIDKVGLQQRYGRCRLGTLCSSKETSMMLISSWNERIWVNHFRAVKW